MEKYNVFVSVFNVLYLVTRAQRVGIFQNRVGMGRERVDSGRTEVLKYSIRYFWVPYLFSGNSGYVGYLG